jgi:hypothetical protein
VLLAAGTIGGIASAASGGSHPAAQTAPPASSAPAQAPKAAALTASSYLTDAGYTVVQTWSHASWLKDSKNSPVTPYLASGADVAAAGKLGTTAEIVFKLSPSGLANAQSVADSLNKAASGGNMAKVDGGFLVTSMQLPTSDDTGSAAPASAAPATSAPAQAPAAPAPTVSQQQALDSAKSYLDMGTGFSRAGLIKQLSSPYGEKFSTADATWAVDHSGADWDAQAVMSAKSYMQTGGFSRAGLIDQLTSPYGEQFTLAQATYAVNQVGL